MAEDSMKKTALILTILCASVALANTRQWKDATVTNITSESGGAAAAPIGGVMVAVPITKTFYWIETEDTTYILGPAITKRQLLNVTLYWQNEDRHRRHERAHSG
jgi:hypothetical protein